MGPQIFQKSRSHLEILSTTRLTGSKFYIEGSEILGATIQNFGAWVTWHPGFVHPWCSECWPNLRTEYVYYYYYYYYYYCCCFYRHCHRPQPLPPPLILLLLCTCKSHSVPAVKANCVICCLCFSFNKTDFRLNTANNSVVSGNPV
jgi:hypothetical protein